MRIETLDERNQWREQYLHIERSKQQLQKDLTIAFDEIHELKRDRRSLKNWVKLLGVVVTVEGSLLAWFATSLLDCLEAGHKLVGLVRMMPLLLVLLVTSGCAARHPSHPGITYFVGEQCHLSAYELGCDQTSPPRCRKIALSYDKQCEQIVGSGRH